MGKKIQKVFFSRNRNLDVEVMSFPQLLKNLNKPNIYNPFIEHRVEFYCIMIVSQNSYTHFVDFKPYKLIKGSALFVARNQVHQFTKELKEASGFFIIFSSLFMEKNYFSSNDIKFNRLFNYHIETPVIHQKEMGQDSFIDVANLLYEEYLNPNEFAKSEMLRTLLHTLLLKAERTKEVKMTSGTKLHWLEMFSSFKDVLEKEYINTRNAKNYAARLFVSYKFLNDIVKHLTGKTVKAFIDDYVTMEIERNLVSTSFSIKEISYKTGFKEPANMIKFFKKNTNITPLKFRQLL